MLLQKEISGSGFKSKGSQDQINLGLEDMTNSPEDFERDSRFRLPSDINFSANKRTFISQADNPNHLRGPSNITIISNLDNDNQNGLKIKTTDSPLHLNTKKVMMNLQQENDEFNPKPKYKITSRQSQAQGIIKMRTSHFGKMDHLKDTNKINESIKIETQTFSITQIIQNIQKKQNKISLKSSIETPFNIKTPPGFHQRPQTELQNYSDTQQTQQILGQIYTEQQNTPINKHQQYNNQAQNNKNNSSFRSSFTKVKSNAMIQQDYPFLMTEIKSRNIDVQVGESLNLYKPPLATVLKNQKTTQNNTLESQLSNQIEHNRTFLDAREQLKNLTQQNSTNTSKISNTTPMKSGKRKSIQERNNSDQIAQPGEIRLPPLAMEDDDDLFMNRVRDSMSGPKDQKQRPSLLMQIPQFSNFSHNGTPKSQRSQKSHLSRNMIANNNQSNSVLKDLSFQSDKKKQLAHNIPDQIRKSQQNLSDLITGVIEQHHKISDDQNQNNKAQITPQTFLKDSFMPTSSHPSISNLPMIESPSDENLQSTGQVPSVDVTQQPSRNNGEESKSGMTMLQMFNNNNDHEKKVLNKLIENNEKTVAYEVVLPKSPPRLIIDSSPLLQSLPKKLQQSIASKQDSFFGGQQTKSIDDEYLIDYIISNEDGEMSSLINSNPQLKSIIQNRKSMLAMLDQNSTAKNINMTLNGTSSINNTMQIKPFNSTLQNGVSLGSIEENDKNLN